MVVLLLLLLVLFYTELGVASVADGNTAVIEAVSHYHWLLFVVLVLCVVFVVVCLFVVCCCVLFCCLFVVCLLFLLLLFVYLFLFFWVSQAVGSYASVACVLLGFGVLNYF